MRASKTVRLTRSAVVVAALGSLLAALVACSSDDAEGGDRKGTTGEAPSQFTPGEAPAMPPIAPGAGPASPAPDTPKDPPPDAKAPVNEAGATDAPADVVSQ